LTDQRNNHAWNREYDNFFLESKLCEDLNPAYDSPDEYDKQDAKHYTQQQN
jgi:hypothetical protein